jgi:hypothetical protein
MLSLALLLCPFTGTGVPERQGAVDVLRPQAAFASPEVVGFAETSGCLVAELARACFVSCFAFASDAAASTIEGSSFSASGRADQARH